MELLRQRPPIGAPVWDFLCASSASIIFPMLLLRVKGIAEVFVEALPTIVEAFWSAHHLQPVNIPDVAPTRATSV